MQVGEKLINKCSSVRQKFGPEDFPWNICTRWRMFLAAGSLSHFKTDIPLVTFKIHSTHSDDYKFKLALWKINFQKERKVSTCLGSTIPCPGLSQTILTNNESAQKYGRTNWNCIELKILMYMHLCFLHWSTTPMLTQSIGSHLPSP